MAVGQNSISRRSFLKRTSTLAAFSIIPIHCLAGRGHAAPSETINIANIGINGMGRADINSVNGKVNFVAMCDVDWNHAKQTFIDFPQTKPFKDFRKMLDAVENEIDAVMVSTPDHTHAVAAMDVLKRKKHLYCQKPLAHSIYEVRQLMQAAKANKVITQLGNQGHSGAAMRNVKEWVADGAIGTVTEANCFCNSNYSRIRMLDKVNENHRVPKTLSWNLWQGPVKARKFNPMYLPSSWRGWSSYGSGVIGDWFCHVVDPVYWALDLGYPETIVAEAKDYDPVKHQETFPAGVKVTYTFPADGKRKTPFKLTWYDGVENPPRPEDLEEGRNLPGIGGVIIGDKGKIMHGSHGAGGARIIPEAKMKAYNRPAKTLERVRGSHYDNWLDSIKSNTPAGSDFSYGGPLTEIALLGIIAIKHLGQTLTYDHTTMSFKDNPSANEAIKPTFRKGWTL